MNEALETLSARLLTHGHEKLRGFNLIEIAMLVMLGGMILSAYVEMQRITQHQDKIDSVREKLTRIDSALNTYLTKNGHLPCPAPLTGVSESQRDSVKYGVASDCSGAAASGLVASGTVPNAVYFGAIPTRTLNLPDEYMVDPWLRRFTYAVTGPMATTKSSYDLTTNGMITVKDPAGTVMATNSAYAVISAGPDGVGAYMDEGNIQYLGCPTLGTTRDSTNCAYNKDDIRADDTSLPNKSLHTEASGTNHFDDYALWSPKKAQVLGAINRYISRIMGCNAIAPSGCSTYAATAQQIRAKVTTNPKANGQKLYEETFEAESSGTAAIKALIPVRYDNRKVFDYTTTHLPFLPIAYEPAFLAALYVDGIPIVFGDIVNPPGLVLDSGMPFLDVGGAAGTIIGQANITKGVNYKVEIYLFLLNDPGIDDSFGSPGNSVWAGTIRTGDYNVDGTVEIMESGLQ